MPKKNKYVSVTFNKETTVYCEPAELEDFIMEEVGARITELPFSVDIKEVKMTSKQYAKLAEWDG
jgi:hypothetical protein